MADRDTTILFVGDMHLGRLPARVPVDAGGDRLPALAELGPGAAWRRTAEAAARLGVDAVALAGDVVEGVNLFEGANELAAGLAILAAARIPVVAVAGNHDTHVLPDLARRGEIVLLGPHGTWSTLDLNPTGGVPARLVGWSFPAPHCETSPLATRPPVPSPGQVTFGLLHADLDAPGSRYAPVMRAELAATGYTRWVLGHVHRPDEPPTDGGPFYLGSLTGLDPTETGRHGPVLARVRADGGIEWTRLPLAPLIWLGAGLDLGTADEPVRDLPSLVRGALEDAVLALPGGPGEALAVGVRLALTGEVADPAGLRRAAALLGETTETWLRVGPALCFLEKLENDVRERLDLTALAAGDDPVGLMARRILTLSGANPVPGVTDAAAWRAALLREARGRLAGVDALPPFAVLQPADDETTVGRELLAAARAVLAQLLVSKGDGHAPDPD